MSEIELLHDAEALIGKTISRVEWAGEGLMALHFTDGTAVIMRGYSAWESPTIEILEYTPEDCDLKDLGIITEDEYERRRAEREREEHELAEADDRMRYERLKAKYGDE